MSLASANPAGMNRRLALRRRADLEAVPQTFGGERFWAIKDPVRLRYFHLRDEEYCIFASLDGTATLDGLREKFEREFAPRRLAISQLQSFLATLHGEGLLLADAPGQTDELLKRFRKTRLRDLGATASNVLAIRFRGLDPQRALDWLAPRCAWLFSPWTLGLGCLLVVAALLLVLFQFDTVQARWPDANSLLTPANMIWLSLALGVTKVLHELGHAVTCRHFGRDCHEMGLLLLVFTPCLYCNVTDAWMIESKWQRAAVGAAGVFVELVLAALGTFGWWFSEPGLFNTLCFHLMLVCSVSTLLFNGNPLLRYDGYFILADLVEIPNLSQHATAVLRDWGAGTLLGIPVERDGEQSRWRRLGLGLFGLASAVYRVAITLGILLLLHNVLKPHRLEVLVEGLACLVLIGMLAGPLWRIGKFLQQASWNRDMRPRRALFSGLVLTAGAAAVLFVPLPHRVAAPALMDAGTSRHVYVTVPGSLVKMAKLGAVVSPEEPIAVLENLELKYEIAQLTGKRNEQKLKLENLKRRRATDPAAAALIPTADESLADLEERLARRLADEQRLVITAPVAGTLLPVRRKPQRETDDELETWSGSPLDEPNLGSALETGTLLCQIGDPKKCEGWLVLDQRDIDFVQAGQRVEVQLEQSPGRILTGTVREIAELDLQVIPVELLPAGTVPTRVDESGRHRPVHTAYQVRVDFERTDITVLVGEAGQARIVTAPRSLARRIGRFLSHTFRFEI
ncbi:MAG: HlyD family efflux transporter periplasmic adaptor subunit [Planctomycetes bacterium]|nr:HlyD family efflux transporter periplasmic adaptor subunit [Planctomycetota bacterium]